VENNEEEPIATASADAAADATGNQETAANANVDTSVAGAGVGAESSTDASSDSDTSEPSSADAGTSQTLTPTESGLVDVEVNGGGNNLTSEVVAPEGSVINLNESNDGEDKLVFRGRTEEGEQNLTVVLTDNEGRTVTRDNIVLTEDEQEFEVSPATITSGDPDFDWSHVKSIVFIGEDPDNHYVIFLDDLKFEEEDDEE